MCIRDRPVAETLLPTEASITISADSDAAALGVLATNAFSIIAVAVEAVDVIEEAIGASITIAPATEALLDGVAATEASITIAAEIEAAEDTFEATAASITIAGAIEAEAEGVAPILKLA